MLIGLTVLNKGPKTHAVLESSKTLCGQPLIKEPGWCGVPEHVTCIGCQKLLVNRGLLKAEQYLFYKRVFGGK